MTNTICNIDWTDLKGQIKFRDYFIKTNAWIQKDKK